MVPEKIVLPVEPISGASPQQEEILPKAEGYIWRRVFPLLALIFLVLFVAAAAGAFYFYRQATTLQSDPQQVAVEETRQVIASVGKLIILPEGEEPTIATVTDLERLKDQPFFAKATLGDKVLIYTNARKAILYNPTANKIVEVAPLNIGDQGQ